MDLSLLFWIVVGILFVAVPFAAAMGLNEIIGNLMTPPKASKAKTSLTTQEDAEVEANVLKMIRKAKELRARQGEPA